MSSYLSFYLVPVKSKSTYPGPEGNETIVELNQTPLRLFTFCRSSDIYQQYYESLSPAYCGNSDKYTELTYEDTQKVIKDFKREEINPTEERLKSLYKILKEAGYNEDVASEIMSCESYLKALNDSLKEMEIVSSVVYDVYNYSDFEKVLINVD